MDNGGMNVTTALTLVIEAKRKHLLKIKELHEMQRQVAKLQSLLQEADDVLTGQIEKEASDT